jgi:alkanesulfonate monooxygenase SsuD/methylene tetrahydromethanopterin reductase-like flavin-dependent oxidoreductase (luciferase family)
MKLGMFMHPIQDFRRGYHTLLKEDFEIIKCADAVGFDEVWLGEHRVSEYGTLPDTLVFAGAVAQVTKQIRIGTAVVVLPFHNPVQIAEQVAMVDVMSDGRFDLGIGRGYQRKEFEAMNIDQNEATPRFREGAAIVEGLLHNEHFTYEGDFWTLNDVTVYPRPVQERIRIGVAVIKTPESFDWVINRGYFALCGNPYALDPELKEGFEEYVRAMERAGGGPGMGNIYSNVFAYAHEDGRKARELAKYSSELYFQRLTAHGTVTGGDGKLPQGYESYTNWDSKVVTGGIPYEEMVEQPFSLIGDPPEIVDKLHAMYEEYGFQNPILWINRGGAIPQAEILKTMELFANKVIPEVAHLGEPSHAVAPASS